jgi:hypothetical protein
MASLNCGPCAHQLEAGELARLALLKRIIQRSNEGEEEMLSVFWLVTLVEFYASRQLGTVIVFWVAALTGLCESGIWQVALENAYTLYLVILDG